MAVKFPEFERNAIDIHSHFDHGAEGEQNGFGMLSVSTLDFMQEDNQRFGIKEVGYSTYASVLSSANIVEENAYLNGLLKENKDLYQWVVVHPLQEETFRQAERMLENPRVLGIKIHSPMHKYDVRAYGDQIFSFANAHNATVLMHPDKILDMPQFADRYPNMKLIIAHQGGGFAAETRACAPIIRDHENAYMELCGSLDNALPTEAIVDMVGEDKVIFGTDAINLDPKYELGKVAFAPMKDEVKKKIFAENYLKVLQYSQLGKINL